MQTISLSANIENGFPENTYYIVTPNVQRAVKNITDKFSSGIHSFSIIGSYGTGKSSFLIALEKDLKEKKKRVLDFGSISSLSECDIINIVGDYACLSTLLRKKLGVEGDSDSILDELKKYYESCKKAGKFLLIVIDEFGKILEHAAQNNPESELYFIQKLAEFVNVPTRNVMLLTTLHQNFGSYARKLTENQKNEWVKVKGRFQEITFVEPAEVLLNLVSKQINQERKTVVSANAEVLVDLAHQTKIVTDGFSTETAFNLYPLDPFSAVAVTEAILRYGQNERSLVSFLLAKGTDSVADFVAQNNLTYNLSKVYDYVNYVFYSVLKDANADSMKWQAVSSAIGRAENIEWPDVQDLASAIKIIKAIGVLSIFAPPSFVFTIEHA